MLSMLIFLVLNDIHVVLLIIFFLQMYRSWGYYGLVIIEPAPPNGGFFYFQSTSLQMCPDCCYNLAYITYMDVPLT